MRILSLVCCLFIAGCDSTPNSAIALGTLERNRIAHTATANEVVVALPIAQGSRVNQGDVIVQLDNTLQSAQVDRAQALMQQAQANLEKLRHGARAEEVAAARANVSGARSALEESQASYDRVLNLKNQKLTSQAELDKAKTNRSTRQAQLDEALEKLLALTNGTREEDLRAGEAALNAAKASLKTEQKRLQDLTITATRDGILDNLPWNLGERVTIGSPLAIVLAGNAPYARIYVPEPKRVHIKVGDELSISVDGLDREIQGKVRWIASEPAFTPYYALNQEERARLMYRAEVQLPESESSLPNGVPVQVALP